MPTSDLVLRSVDSSSLPHSEKTAIRRFYEKIAPRAHSMAATVQSKLGISSHTAVKGTEALRSLSEGLAVGAGLGLLDAKVGLDVKVPFVGDGSYTLPADAVLSGAAYIASLVGSLSPVADDLQRVGLVGAASWAQRSAKSWAGATATAPAASTTSTTPASGTTPAAGEFGQDDVLAWARQQS